MTQNTVVGVKTVFSSVICVIRGLALVNWQNFYDYFDTQLNDKNNRYKREINYFKFYPGGIGASNNTKGMTVMQILNKYRDQLLHNNYDII